jgi:hypothetical protein
MPDPHLAEWESFYVIVGSSSAALTGLQFVVIALVADLIGIHNAWDAAVCVTQFGRSDGSGGEPPASEDTGD